MATLKTPLIAVVIGEGGSGGALAIGVGDRLLMLEYGIYSVISPEGCASILWKSADKAEAAAEALGLTAERLAELDLVDEIIKEPLGGAHRDLESMSEALKTTLLKHLTDLQAMPTDKLVELRNKRIRAMGRFRET